ncbi:MAG: iron-sulfur cluster repair di-iron protein [Rhodospirillaceae bacterium]|nr:iron-sulfur cluster repair di-iron protein [Rhodospirillaceae bacterium]
MITQTNPDLDRLSVGELAATLPDATAVFRKFKVNFCCRGDIRLADAARQRGLKASELEEALRALEGSDAPPSLSMGTNELIDHILSRFHEVHRRELTELVALARKVEAVHANHPQAPHGLADLLQQMRGELEVYMKKEELILFPAMRRGAGASLDAPIAQMRHDHNDHGEHLRRLEALTNDFTPPGEACRSWQALYTGTAKLSEDLMEHVHLENYVLFPRFQEIPTP